MTANSVLILCQEREEEPKAGYSESQARREASRCLQCEDPPCIEACPAHVDIKKYIFETREGNYKQALETMIERLPFPGICGRVCPRPCEDACTRYTYDPISIRGIKRFIADQFTDVDWCPKALIETTGKKIAVIGSGPAGLTAAYFLVKMGYGVTIFEATPEPGGLIRVVIPKARLPHEIIDKEINNIKNLGVEIKLNTKIDTLDPLFDRGYSAILVATGSLDEKRSKPLARLAAGKSFQTPNELEKERLNVEAMIFKGTKVSTLIREEKVLRADPETLAVSREGVFAAGETITGPKSVIHAVGSGRKAAISIDKYLGGNGKLPAGEMSINIA
jgi:NADPH-dependent glutamate synthase beta subunit-like oxidoreductase